MVQNPLKIQEKNSKKFFKDLTSPESFLLGMKE
jgi:hypothetical protein